MNSVAGAVQAPAPRSAKRGSVVSFRVQAQRRAGAVEMPGSRRPSAHAAHLEVAARIIVGLGVGGRCCLFR